METITVTAKMNPDSYELKLADGEKKKVFVDFSPWCDDNEDIVSINWDGAHEDLVVDGNTFTAVVTDKGCHTITVTTANLITKLFIRVGYHDHYYH